MNKNNFINDLKVFLENKSKLTQRNEVVYLLVRIRKILDLDGSNRYKTLRFYCNWVLHTKLDKLTTTKLTAFQRPGLCNSMVRSTNFCHVAGWVFSRYLRFKADRFLI